MNTTTSKAVLRQRPGRAHRQTLVELERYRNLVENVIDYAIFLLDSDGNVITWNKGAERYKGYKAHEIIGRHFSTFYPPEDIAADKPGYELVQAQRYGRVEDEGWRLRKDGSRFWANVVITAMYDPDGRLAGYAKVTRDLTERKRHEDMLRQTNELLKLQQQELRQLNASKDEFISLASHQLRTPATGIKQFLGILLEGFAGEVEPSQLELLRKAYASNERQLAIVNSLLKVAQIDAGNVRLKKTPTDIRTLLYSVLDEHMDCFQRRNQRLQVEVAEHMQDALVDTAHFRMALDNLVDNASKYTPEGGLISLSARTGDGCLLITIEDSGVGIAAEDLPRLYEKFTRIPNSLSDTVGGSGLGLYWVDKVIQLHGGNIEVESEVGRGTVFQVHVPLY